jgi:hypothetical protein
MTFETPDLPSSIEVRASKGTRKNIREFWVSWRPATVRDASPSIMEVIFEHAFICEKTL